jgi:hypothetical protein
MLNESPRETAEIAERWWTGLWVFFGRRSFSYVSVIQGDCCVIALSSLILHQEKSCQNSSIVSIFKCTASPAATCMSLGALHAVRYSLSAGCVDPLSDLVVSLSTLRATAARGTLY